MWSIHRQRIAPSEITPRQFSTPHSCQELWNPRQVQSPPSLLPSKIVTNDSYSNEPTFPYAFGTQQPIVPPSLNDLNLPPNPFNVLATMAVFQQDQVGSPQSPEPSDPSPISKPPMNLSTIEGWETPHTTTDDNTLYLSENEPRLVYWDFSPNEIFDSNEPRRVSFASSPSTTPPPPTRQKRTLSLGMSFTQKGGVSQHFVVLNININDASILHQTS